jgi:SanA protein
MSFKKITKPLLVSALTLGGLLLVLFINTYIANETKSKIYTDISKIPPKKAALLLGTSKYVSNGRKNYFYIYRIEAAVKLYKAGKIRALLVSGDNSTKYYDEPTTMRDDLIKAGIPKRYITLDYAGFRTLDSVVRAKEIFDVDDYIIISQKFHLERALFISKVKGQKSIGLVAKDFSGTTADYRMRFRELLARSKAFLDLYILYKEPKFYGKKEIVRYKAQ